MYQIDVKSAFLNGFLQEEIYVEQPEGFVKKGNKEKIYRLRKTFYGIKQAPRSWYGQIDGHLLGLGFEKSLSESTLYFKHHGIDILVASIYVDGLLIVGSNTRHIEDFKQEMMQAFEMTDLGLMAYFLGMEIKQGQD